MPPDENVFEARLSGLQQLMQQGFESLNRRLDEICARMVGMDRFNDLQRRVERTEMVLIEHDTRVDRLERVNYLLGILGGLAMAILTALMIAVITGKLALVVQ